MVVGRRSTSSVFGPEVAVEGGEGWTGGVYEWFDV